MLKIVAKNDSDINTWIIKIIKETRKLTCFSIKIKVFVSFDWNEIKHKNFQYLRNKKSSMNDIIRLKKQWASNIPYIWC